MKATNQEKTNQEATELQLIPVTEAASLKDCTRQTIYNALNRGELTERTFGNIRLVVVNEAFEDWRVKDVGRRVS
jgi:hypothetical protein